MPTRTLRTFTTPQILVPLLNDYSWSFNTDRDHFDFVDLSVRLAYPCTNLRWDVSYPLPSHLPPHRD